MIQLTEEWAGEKGEAEGRDKRHWKEGEYTDIRRDGVSQILMARVWAYTTLTSAYTMKER